MAEGGSDARSYNLFPSRPVVCFEKKEAEKGARRPNSVEGAGGVLCEDKEGRETNGPISFLKRCFSGPFIKKGGWGV